MFSTILEVGEVIGSCGVKAGFADVIFTQVMIFAVSVAAIAALTAIFMWLGMAMPLAGILAMVFGKFAVSGIGYLYRELWGCPKK